MMRKDDEPRPSTVVVTIRLCHEHEAVRRRRRTEKDGERSEREFVAARMCTIVRGDSSCCRLAMELREGA